METGKKTENALKKRITSLLANKPIWVWWISHAAVTGIIFGIFYLVFKLLTMQWWAGSLILITVGIIWGSIRYNQMKNKPETETNDNEDTV